MGGTLSAPRGSGARRVVQPPLAPRTLERLEVHFNDWPATGRTWATVGSRRSCCTWCAISTGHIPRREVRAMCSGNSYGAPRSSTSRAGHTSVPAGSAEPGFLATSQPRGQCGGRSYSTVPRMTDYPTRVSGSRTWFVGGHLAGGGFGQVRLAKSDKSEPTDSYAIKFVPKEPGAERELLFFQIQAYRNVVPVLDRGEIDNYYFLVMPRASHSLKDAMGVRSFSLEAAIAVASDVAAALSDLEGTVVHRDLKPANILYLNGRWCLSDFGISRYADSSTSAITRKYALTPQYAAPERWRHEHAMTATDVYSLGVTLYEVLVGHLPFPGPATENFREQHLHEVAPPIGNIPTALDSLVRECLYKSPQARPVPSSLIYRLRRFSGSSASDTTSDLTSANQRVSIRRAHEQRSASLRRSANSTIAELQQVAIETFHRLVSMFQQAVVDAAPEATVVTAGMWSTVLGAAKVSIESVSLSNSELETPDGSSMRRLNVLAYSSIDVENEESGVAFSYSLWYCNAMRSDNYAWFELGFSGRMQLHSRRPFALSPGTEAAEAIGGDSLNTYLHGPFINVSADFEDTVRRWSRYLASAVAY
jgi:serine/threonine protein kinase